MRRNRMLIVIAILLMSIGFAAVATNLFINGNILIGTNEEDFDVYFSKAIVDGVDESSKVISSDGKSITFVTKNLKSVGETSILDYVVTNNSTQYDADVEVTCTPNETEYFSITNQIKDVVKAQSEENGKTTVILNKKTLEEQKITFTCTITAQAIEREITIGKDETNTYSLGGYLVDSNNEIQPNQSLVVYSNTPHYVTTDLTGYFYVEGLEKGSHEVFYMGNMLIEELKNKTKAEIETSALKKLNITTSSTSAKFDDQLLIKDFVINKTNDVKVVSLNVDDETYNKIVTDEEEVSFKVDKTNEAKWTNIAASNGAIPNYNNGVITVGNITTSTSVYLNNSLKKTIDSTNYTQTNITMLKSENNDNTINIASNKNISLDLNGKTIKSSADTITNLGLLTINDTSEKGLITSSGHNTRTIVNTGKIASLTINNGHILSTSDCDVWSCSAVFSDRNSNLIINSNKEVMYNGDEYKTGTVIETNNGINVWVATGSSAEINGGLYKVNKIADLTAWQALVCSQCTILNINYAETKSDNASIRLQSRGTININDGHFNSPVGIVTDFSDTEGTIKVNGGKFITSGYGIKNSGNSNIVVNNGFFESVGQAVNNSTNGTITIKDGYFERTGGTGTTIYEEGTGTLTIDGGTFKNSGSGSVVQNRLTTDEDDGVININGGNFISNNTNVISNNKGIININQKDKPIYISTLTQTWAPAIFNRMGNINIDANKANKCTSNIEDTKNGLCVYVEGIKSNTPSDVANNGAVLNEKSGNININGGTYFGGKLSVRNSGDGIVRINDAELYGRDTTILNYNANGTVDGKIYVCNSILKGETHHFVNYAIGHIYYSSTNTYGGISSDANLYGTGSSNIIPNYAGTCLSD